MTPDEQEIYDSMPMEDRDRVDKIPDGQLRSLCIQLWARRRRTTAESEAREHELKEQQQDKLDEKLWAKAFAGGYGPEGKQAAADVLASSSGEGRRAVIRAGRIAIQNAVRKKTRDPRIP